MLNTAAWFHGQGQLAELQRISQSENIPNMYKYDAAPHLYWQAPLLYKEVASVVTHLNFYYIHDL
jgi:hypothetical protein